MNKEKFNKKKLLIFGLPIFCLVLVSAVLLTYYGQIQQNVNVKQAVVLSGMGCVTDVDTVCTATPDNGFGGDTFVSDVYTLANNADTLRNVNLVTTYELIDADEITTSYYGLIGYSEEFLAVNTHLSRTDITVEDLGDSILWTMKTPTEYTVFGEGIGSGGQATWSVSIGVGDEILYQVHMNDGVDSGFENGKYLYSEYEGGWLTGTGGNNVLVTSVDGIEATGDYIVTNGIYTIQIDKELLDFREFKWSVYIPYENYESLPDGFGWSDTNTNNFRTATIAEELINPITIPAEDSVGFVVLSKTADLSNGFSGTITTTINPVA